MSDSRKEDIILFHFDAYKKATEELADATSDKDLEEKIKALKKAEQKLIYHIGFCSAQGWHEIFPNALENDKEFREWAYINKELKAIKDYGVEWQPNETINETDSK